MRASFDVDGRRLAIGNLDRVIYPAPGVTKAGCCATTRGSRG